MGRVWPDHRSLFGNSKFFSQAKVRMGWIYLIRNKVNGKSYVGQTIHNNVERRWCNHRTIPTGRLKYAFAKYGLENFEFSTICEIPEGEGWRELMNAREIREISERNTIVPNGYNLEAGGNKRTSIHEETREKLSRVNLGRKRTAETRERIRESRIGTKASNETKAKMSKAKIGVNNPNVKIVEQWSKDRNTLIEVHDSLASAAIRVGLANASKISMCSSGKRQSAGGFYWKLREQEPV